MTRTSTPDYGTGMAECLLLNEHDEHTWWYTSEGGGHMLSEPDPDAKGFKEWRCPGLTEVQSLERKLAQREAQITTLQAILERQRLAHVSAEQVLDEALVAAMAGLHHPITLSGKRLLASLDAYNYAVVRKS